MSRGAAVWFLLAGGLSVHAAPAAAPPPKAPAAPAPAPAPAGGITLGVSWSNQERDGRRMNIMRVTGKAPLPERARLTLEITYAPNPLEFAPIIRVAEVHEGNFEAEVAADEKKLMPGDYLLAATVNDTEHQLPSVRGRITPEALALTGNFRACLGEPQQICAYINKSAADFIKHSLVIHREYPDLARQVMRAHQKALTQGEWNQWRGTSEMSKSDKYLSRLLIYQETNRALMPRTMIKLRQMLVSDIGSLKASVDSVFSPVQTKETALDAKLALGRLPQKLEEAKPDTIGLHTTMLQEGRAAYAVPVAQIFDAVEAAYADRRGKGAGNWDALVPKWTQELDALEKLFDAFGGLEWMLEAVVLSQKRLEMKECFALVRKHIDACGKVLLENAPKEPIELENSRQDLRKRLEGLKRPTPA